MLALFGLLFVTAGEYGGSDAIGASKVVAALKSRMVAALDDPLSLLAKRSPGGRGRGALQLTKSAALPHERVLSQVRQRIPAPALVPATEAPVLADNAPDIAAGIPPAPIVTPEAPGATPIEGSLMPLFATPLGFPGSPGGASGPGFSDSPGGPGNPSTPPGGSDTPPGGSTTGSPSPTFTVDEPATWLLMILGLAVLFMMRRMEISRTAGSQTRDIECGFGCDHWL